MGRQSGAVMTLDLAIRGGTVWTMDRQRPLAEGVGVKGAKIVFVGDRSRLRRMCEPRTLVIDAERHTVIPGFTDAHFHLLDYARGFLGLALDDARSAEECVQRVAKAHERTPPGQWIVGRGWNHDEWERPRWPHRRDLDAAVGDRAVFLVRKDGHSAWLNTAALKAGGLWNARADLIGLRMEAQVGRQLPTGLVQEHALDEAWRSVPEPPEERTLDCLDKACETLNRLGIIAVHDCGGGGVVPYLRRLEQRRQLTLRCWATVSPEELVHLDDIQGTSRSERSLVKVGGLKVFVDGSLGSRTAHLVEPYEDDPSNTGTPLLTREELGDLMSRAAERDLYLVAHVIGDGAARVVFDATERHTEKTPPIRLEHLQLLHPDDIPRLMRHPFVASMQPYHLSTDIRVAARAWGRRCRLAYAWATVAARVPVLAFGSDCPVEPPDPRLGLWSATTRHGADGRSRGGWFPAERLGLGAALRCYTYGSAAASGDAAARGSIHPGKLADLVVLEGSLSDGTGAEIRERRILLTTIAGKVVHRDEALS